MSGFAQPTPLQQYLKQLNTTKNATEKIELYYNIANEYNLEGNDSMEYIYNNIAIGLSKKNNKPLL